MFSYRQERQGETIVDLLIDEQDGLRIAVSRLGAELVSLARRNQGGDWVGFLYRDNDLTSPPQGWTNHATVMGYYLHRLKDGRSLYRGHEIKGGNHSFLRTKTWEFIDGAINEGELRYRITPDQFGPSEYPLKVSLDLTYRIDHEQAQVTFHVTNHEPELSAHVGFGLHPGFAATSFDAFRFSMPPGKYRRHLAPNNFLSGETTEINFGGGEMPFGRDELPGSFILELVDVPDRQFTFSDRPSGRMVIVDLSGVPYLTLWSDGGPFLCIEPCWGLTDHERQRAFEEKEGIQQIPPGGQLTASFAMGPVLEN
jgi:galactose mutarotase-like enzyme